MIKWFPLVFQNIESFQRHLVDWMHDYILLFLVFILIFVGGVLMSLSKNRFFSLKMYDAPLTEFFWSVSPGVILVLIGIPSLSVLYRREALVIPDLTIKIVGHQWYWTYDYSDFQNIEFDCYLKTREDLLYGEPRLLQTDNHVVVPYISSLRLVVSSTDVLHRWAIPRIRLKIDANPGRINILFINKVETTGVFFGQCSEICGANHSFMPICVERRGFFNFNSWLTTF